MLQHLLVKNFQCHRSLSLDLDHPITCIVGNSDQGKSAIVRALSWLAFNKPSGNSFLRRGAKTVEARLTVGDKEIVRSKGAINSYSCDGKRLEAFGTGKVPEGIANLLNLGEVNFQSQHQPHFWFSKTAGEVAKELNAIVDLSLIDRTMYNLAARLRKCRAAVEISQDRLKAAREERDKLSWVPEAEKGLRELEKNEAALLEGRGRQERLRTLLGELEQQQELRSRSKKMLAKAKEILEKGERVVQNQDRAEGLGQLLDSIQQEEKQLCQTKGELETAKQKLKIKLKGRCPICRGPLKRGQR